MGYLYKLNPAAKSVRSPVVYAEAFEPSAFDHNLWSDFRPVDLTFILINHRAKVHLSHSVS